ncbi:MAG: pilus assembly protein [Chloroflexi bacterium]|nr:pilus assembly protein [Chloroflexota bacterium]
MRSRQKENGQSIVELTLVLPFIFLLLVAVVEAGFALRDYVMVQSVNREGVRWAVRTPPTGGDVTIFDAQVNDIYERVRQAAGNAGLRPEDVNIVVTYIYLVDVSDPPDGVYDQAGNRVYASPSGYGGNSLLDVAALSNDNLLKYTQINDLRGDNEYGALENELVIVEVFYRHETVWGMDIVGPFGEDWTMYAQSSMRMIGTGRAGQ